MSETIMDRDIQAKRDVAVQAKTWHYHLRNDPDDAAQFANQPPAQLAGEAQFSVRDDGQVDLFLFY